ncbi:MAG TPA: ATP-binding protein [Stellaceae bacterium]|nr:ATP-binding protein [Stellaceae bacterium]
MPNPKDWFRRRRAPSADDLAERDVDPFSSDGILDLGRAATLLREAEPPAEHKPPIMVEKRGPVPPPPHTPMPRREGMTLDRSAFAVRPEIVRSVEPQRRFDARAAAQGAMSVLPSPFALRRGATQLAPAPRPVAEPPEAKPVPPPRPVAETKVESDPPAPQSAPAPTASAGSDPEQAAFTLAAPGISWKRNRPTLPDAARTSALLRDAFTPTRPKHGTALFSGRFKQLQRIIAAIEEERAHVMVYGERGSGKTSLANVLAVKAEEAGYMVLRFACSSELTFEDIFRGFLRRMPASLLPDGVGATSRAGIDNFDQLLPGRCSVGEIVQLFERVYEKHLILIVDEYDRVTEEDTKAKLAELLKHLSDANVSVTLLIIGVAENVGQLLGKHPSLQRTMVTVPMPLMTRRELDGIIAVGEEKSGLSFDPWTRQSLIDLAQGLPYHAHLLALFAARNATRRQSSRIEREDLRYAVERSAEEAEARVKEAYDLAVGPHENASFRDVLFYAARCRTDEFGSFTAPDVAAAAAQTNPEALSLLALQYPLKKLTEPERGSMLRRMVGPGGLRYQFTTQSLRHHVLCRQMVQRGLV